MAVVLRQATRADIAAMHRVRLAVRENVLVSAASVTEQDYVLHLERCGRGWVVEDAGEVVAMAAASRDSGNVWALFVHPDHERRGHGRALHDAMLQWLWAEGVARAWLSTEPGTRAQRLYERAGWRCTGVTARGEVGYEMDAPRPALNETTARRASPPHPKRPQPAKDPTMATESLPLPLPPEVVRTLEGVTTATLTTVLLKKGLRNVWLRGTRPLGPARPRVVGRAFTLRFVPAREDLATPASWGAPISTRAAIEAMPAGCIAVVGALGVTDAGIFGDILCARMKARGVAALVSDGVVRDLDGVLRTSLPVWCRGAAAPPSVAGLTFVGWQQPIGCGGVAVFPDDVVVADNDGAVLIPQALLDDVVAAAVEQERLEGWIMAEVERGAALPGLYPPNAENAARYEAWRRGEGGG